MRSERGRCRPGCPDRAWRRRPTAGRSCCCAGTPPVRRSRAPSRVRSASHEERRGVGVARATGAGPRRCPSPRRRPRRVPGPAVRPSTARRSPAGRRGPSSYACRASQGSGNVERWSSPAQRMSSSSSAESSTSAGVMSSGIDVVSTRRSGTEGWRQAGQRQLSRSQRWWNVDRWPSSQASTSRSVEPLHADGRSRRHGGDSTPHPAHGLQAAGPSTGDAAAVHEDG